jgi:aminoglycoside phosphotransferase (APT) family kinase protein
MITSSSDIAVIDWESDDFDNYGDPWLDFTDVIWSAPFQNIGNFANTYSGSNYDDIWKSMFSMCDLFHALALLLAEHFGFAYRQNEEDGMREYLRMVKENEC